MAIKLYPDAQERVTIVLASDPVLAAANDTEALAAYSATGDESKIVIPADATRVEIAPLSASARAKIYNIMAVVGETEDEQMDAIARLQVFTVECGLRGVSDMPDVVPVYVSGSERYPTSAVNRLGGPTIWDIAQHINRISELPEEGKGRSSAPSGSDTTEPGPDPGTASSAKSTRSGSGNAEAAAAPSNQTSAEPSNAKTG